MSTEPISPYSNPLEPQQPSHSPAAGLSQWQPWVYPQDPIRQFAEDRSTMFAHLKELKNLEEAYGQARDALNPPSIQEQALALPFAGRQMLIFSLASSLGDDAPSVGVEKTPGVVGGSACLVRTRIPVWILESYRRSGLSAETILGNFPTLRRTDLVSAWIYARLHREEIDKDIRENADE